MLYEVITHPQRELARAGVGMGARVATLDGMLPIEFLSPGDRVVTRAGARTLRAVTVHVVHGECVRLAPGVLGHDRPEGALVVGAGTPLLIRGWRATALYGCAQTLRNNFV